VTVTVFVVVVVVSGMVEGDVLDSLAHEPDCKLDVPPCASATVDRIDVRDHLPIRPHANI
jgi:hypothetical protein